MNSMKINPWLKATFAFVIVLGVWSLLGQRSAALKADNRVRSEQEQESQQKQILAKLPMVSLPKPKFMRRWSSLPMVFRLEFSPDGAWLAVGSDSNVDVRDARDWKSRAVIPGSPRLAWAPNSRLLAVDWRQGVNLYAMPGIDVAANLTDGSGTNSAGKDGSAGVYGPMIFSADSSKIATMGEDPQSKWKLDDGPATEAAYVREIAVKVWDAKTGKRLSVKPGPWSNGDNPLARLTDDPAQIEFAQPVRSQYAVSNTRPPVYIFNARSDPNKLFGFRTRPAQAFATIPILSGGYVGAIAGNAWIYATIDNSYPTNLMKIFRTRDRQLLASLPFPSRITDVALSPDAKTVAVAEDHATEKTFADGSTMELSRSQISIYRLFPTVK